MFRPHSHRTVSIVCDMPEFPSIRISGDAAERSNTPAARHWKTSAEEHLGVDQNKRAWERYNRRSTANQSRTHGWQSRRDFVLSNVICTENEIDISIYTQRYIQVTTLKKLARDIAWPWASDYIWGLLNRLTIADLSITNMTWKLGPQKDWHCKCCVCLGK